MTLGIVLCNWDVMFSSDTVISGHISISRCGLPLCLSRIALRQFTSENSSKTTVYKS